MTHSIVNIESLDENNKSFGTGFVIDQDNKGVYVLTCKHVIDDVKNPMVEEVKARIIAQNDFIDMAVLYVSKLHLPPLPLQIDPCTSLHVDVIGFSHFNNNMTQKKHIKATLFKEPIELHSNNTDTFYRARKIKADDDYNFDRGNSGSPVICQKSGQVIAMLSNKEGNNLGYAIEISNLKEVWIELPHTLFTTAEIYSNETEKEAEAEVKRETTLKVATEISQKKLSKLHYTFIGLVTMILLLLGYILFTSNIKKIIVIPTSSDTKSHQPERRPPLQPEIPNTKERTKEKAPETQSESTRSSRPTVDKQDELKENRESNLTKPPRELS